MNAFEEPFWNLDQLRAWMISRTPEAVQFARIGNDPRDMKESWQIKRFAELAARRMAKEGRNIKEELWAASGLDRSTYQKNYSLPPVSPKERELRELCEKLPSETELFIEEALTRIGRARLNIGGLGQVVPEKLSSLLKEVLAETAVQGPPRMVVVNIFPCRDYLIRLFRKGALIGTGQLPGEPLSVEMLPAHWAGLEIAIGEDTQRLGVWRVGRPANAKRDFDRLFGREDLRSGAGDIENVRVQRDEILNEFPERMPCAQNLQKKKSVSDDTARELIREIASKNDGYVTQEKGAIILQSHDPSMKRDRARNIVKSVIGNEKTGPRGPRNNSAK